MMVLKEEIDRIKEIMGLKIIVESVLPSYIKKFISLILESSENSAKELDNVVKKINPENSIDLSDITKGYKTIDDYPEINWTNVIEELIDGPNGSTYKKILYTALENDIKTSSAGKILKELGDGINDKDSLIELSKKDPKLYKEYIDFIENSYNNILKVFTDDIETLNIVKKISGLDEDNLKYLKSLIASNVDNILTNLSKELKNQSLDISKKFRQKWFSMMKKVENRLGEPWKATDEEKEKLSTILSAINEKTKGDTIYFTLPVSGKTVKIQPQEILNTQLSNYKLIYNKDGSVSSLNKVDTHTQDSVNLFFDYVNRQGDSENIIKVINEQMEKGETTKIEEILSKMESDTSFWDDIIENGDDVTKKIAETTATGTAREQLVVNNAKKLFGDDWEVEFQAYEGHPLDRLLGVDLVLKNAAGEYKFVQVKSVNTVRVYETDFGNVAAMFNKDLKLQKPSQLDNIVYVSPKNEVVVASKNRILKYSKELNKLITTEKIGFAGPNMYGYSELIPDTYVIIEDFPEGTLLVKSKG